MDFDKTFGVVGRAPRTNQLVSGGSPNQDPDPEIFIVQRG